MEHIKAELKELSNFWGYNLSDYAFDGELLIKNRDMKVSDEENCRNTSSLLNSKTRTAEEESVLEFVIFDHMTVEEFEEGESYNGEDDSKSMNFPIYVMARFDKDEESYES